MKSDSSAPKRARRRTATQDGSIKRRRSSPSKSAADPSIEPDATREILDCLAAGVVKVSKDGRIVYANAHARRLFDMPDREPVGLSLREYEGSTIWEDGSPCGYDDYPPVKCLRTGEVESDVTIGLQLPGGGVRWVTATAVPILDPKTGEPESAIATVVDSSHPKHVEDSLRESEDRYRRLVEHAPDSIVVHRAGTILLINRAGVKLYGGSSSTDFVGRNVLDLVHPRSRKKAENRMRQSLAGETTPLAVQRHVRVDGQTIYVESTATPCVYGGQQCVQVICRDVTRRRRAEQGVRRAKAELEKRVRDRTEELSDKNAELRRKQRFMERTLAGQERDRKLVAYEIHDTILQDVIGALMFLDAMHAQPRQDHQTAGHLDQARKLLQKSIEESRRMIGGLRPLVIDQQGIIGGVEYLISELQGRGVEIDFTHSMQTERLDADLESTIFRIVQEALANLERHSKSSRGEVTITQSPAAVRVEIRDTGVGFDPDSVREGHFGLEGVRERTRLAGGRVAIRSAPGKGTKVTVDLPLAGKKRPRDVD